MSTKRNYIPGSETDSSSATRPGTLSMTVYFRQKIGRDISITVYISSLPISTVPLVL